MATLLSNGIAWALLAECCVRQRMARWWQGTSCGVMDFSRENQRITYRLLAEGVDVKTD